MTLRTSRQQRTVEAIVETDRRQAAAAAESRYVAESCELAPLSYAAMLLLRGTPALGEALAALADELVRPQVVRFLVERRRATGALWGWGDVDEVEAKFRRLIAATRAEQLAARIGAAQAAKIAAMLRVESSELEIEKGHQDAQFSTPHSSFPILPTPAQIEAALLTRETDAARLARHAHDAGDADGAKLAGRIAQASRDAAALALAGDYRVASNGDLLVRSPRGMRHRVGRRPADGDGLTPICCSCEWGTKRGHVGPCKHEQLYEGYYDALEGGDRDEVGPDAAA